MIVNPVTSPGERCGVKRMDTFGDGGAAQSLRAESRRCTNLRLAYAIAARSAHNWARRKRSALPITDTDDRLIAALAIIGLSSSPSHGKSTPAATGTPSAL